MIARLRDARDNEQGFTLVELLVVIIIIGILAAIAIPAFLNQRQRANDAAVKADVKNIATQVETALVDAPNATGLTGTFTAASNTFSVSATGLSTGNISLTDGVNVSIAGGANRYIVLGTHDNGKNYKAATAGTAPAAPTVPAADAAFTVPANTLVYDSAKGGLLN